MNIQEIVAGITSSGALQQAAERTGVDPGQAQSMLQGVLEHVQGGGDLEGMAEQVAGKVGIDPATVQQFLPEVMGLVQGHAANASEGVQQILGGIVGSLQGSAGGTGLASSLGSGIGGSVAQEAIGLVEGLFSHKS